MKFYESSTNQQFHFVILGSDKQAHFRIKNNYQLSRQNLLYKGKFALYDSR